MWLLLETEAYICVYYWMYFCRTNISLHSKATIHEVATMVATCENVLFPGHNHLLSSSTDDLSLAGTRAIIKLLGHQYWWLVNVNVNVSFYSLKSPLSSADFTIYTLVMELFLIQSHLLWGEFSICALCCSYSQSLQFSFLVPPGTHHCWVDRGSVI